MGLSGAGAGLFAGSDTTRKALGWWPGRGGWRVKRQETNCNWLSLRFEWMKGGLHYVGQCDQVLAATRQWKVPSRRGRMGGDQLFFVVNWFGGEIMRFKHHGVGWVMVKCDEISKICCEQIILLVTPLLCGYKEFSWKDTNKFKISFQHPVNNGRLREDRIPPEPVDWVTSS